ncbi:MAG: type II toxin-antitoxin system death-on-curing family toxin [Candidatus Delongbacteria bacterium]|nr:type II toxin-antitoxin system death-on-curing family toxin [Candidatus Delongbacteria bacterium]
MKKAVLFLTLAEVIEIHNNQIEIYGGRKGLRDITLLSSALSMAETTFEGKYLHTDLFSMAAAYIFHICQNHPFVDGNKRVALVTGLVFLDFNGIILTDPNEELYTMMMKVAKGKENKEFISNILRKLSECIIKNK